MPLDLQQVIQGSIRVAVEPPLEMQWGIYSLVAMCMLSPVSFQCAGGYSLVVSWGSTHIAVRGQTLFVVGQILSGCHLQTPHLSLW